MTRGVDLHLHTRASDGRWTVAGLVERARTAGIGTISITDHDVTDASEEAMDRAARAGVRAIPGVELTVHWRGRPLHVLGYGGPVLGAVAARVTARARVAVDDWARRHAVALLDGPARDDLLAPGAPRTVADVVRAARSVWPRTGKGGVVSAIADFSHRDPPGLDLADAATALADAGAVVILAHPMRRGTLTRALDEPALEDLLDDVPSVHGIEVAHPGHAPPDRAFLGEVAARRAILVTAGSDSHGPARGRPPMSWPSDLARAFLARVEPGH